MKKIFISAIMLCFSISGFAQAGLSASDESQDTKSKREYAPQSVVMVGTSLNSSQNACTLMYGYVKKWGWYGKLKTNFNLNEDYSYETSDNSNAFWNGKVKKGRYSATIGTIFNMNGSLMAYGGLGYGKRWVEWGTVENQNIKRTDYSYKGIESELGLILSVKRFVISGGISTNLNKTSYSEANIAVGLKF